MIFDVRICFGSALDQNPGLGLQWEECGSGGEHGRGTWFSSQIPFSKFSGQRNSGTQAGTFPC